MTEDFDKPGFREIFEEMFRQKPPELGETIADLTPEEIAFIDDLQLEANSLDAAFRVALNDHRKATTALQKKQRVGLKAIHERVGFEIWPKGVDVIFNSETGKIHRQK